MPYRNRRFRKKPIHHEELLQGNFAYWLDAKGYLYTASMAGVNLHPVVGRKRKILGCKSGVPDIMIFEPRGQFHGLFIELKSKDGDVKDEKQLLWKSELNKRGYCSVMMPRGLDWPENLDWLKNIVENYMAGNQLSA